MSSLRDSVYTPGAGHLPPVLAGRDPLLRDLAVGLNEVGTVGRARARDVILVGPRGVGKTVTLSTYGSLAADAGFEVVNLQAVAGRAGLVESVLQRAVSRIAQQSGPWTRARHAFDRIANVSFGMAGMSAGIDLNHPDHVPAVLDPGTLAEALAELAVEVRRDAPNGGLLVAVDEMQVASHSDLALLSATLHRLNVDHPAAAVVFAGTGLSHTPEALRAAGVTHPDRLFILEPLSVSLEVPDATYAIVEPARQAGVSWHPDAVAAVVLATNGYPAHIQLFAHTVWTTAPGPSRITADDVRHAMPLIEADLNRRTLGPRWDRMTDRQMEYLAALALHDGRATSAAVARTLGRSLQELSWIRQDLIREGDIYVPHRGVVALAIPIFAPYILARYEEARETSETALLHLADMRRNRQLPSAHHQDDGPVRAIDDGPPTTAKD